VTWTQTRLKYLAAAPIVNGLGEAAQAGDVTWPRYIRTTDILSPRRLDPAKRVTLPPALASQAKVERDDLLLCAAGSVGKAYLHANDEPACYAGYLVRFRPDRSVVDPRFVAYWAESKPFLDQIAVGAVRSTIDNFSAGKYRGMTLRVPLLEEQQRIAAFLDEQVAVLDRLTTLRQQQADLLEQQRAALFRAELFRVAQLEPPPLDSTPASTGCRPFIKLLTQLTNGFVGPTRDLLVDDGVPYGVPYLQSLHIKGGSIDFDRRPYFVPSAWVAARPRITLRIGDVLIVQTGALGEVAIVEEDMAGASCHALLIARTKDHELRPRFLWHLLRSDWGKAALLREQTGALHPHLEAGKVRDILIPVPTLDQQDELVRRLDEREADSARLNRLMARQIGLLGERKQALITAAVTGLLDVTTARKAA
jgi:type I restriction enzyme S subunit